MNGQINVCIGGIQGYVGRELLQLVITHPYLNLVGVVARNASDIGCDNDMVYITQQHIPVFSLADLNNKQSEIDILLLAIPPQASIQLIAQLKDTSFKIIDLSGAFRLPVDEFKQWYGINHTLPELVDNAQYGLSPWCNKNVNHHKIIANPGCYATCALMTLIPLLNNNLIKTDNIIIDAKSGASGAGKKAHQELMFCELSENFYPYKVGKHQHIPEITNALSQHTGCVCDITFVTHMLPISRGISLAIYVDCTLDYSSPDATRAAIYAAYKSAYADYPLLSFGDINNENPSQDKFLLALKSVIGTPKTHIGFYFNGKKILLFACIDNLLKGAASQAIENINALYHLPLETGLLLKEETL